jgi:hypothetical protein
MKKIGKWTLTDEAYADMKKKYTAQKHRCKCRKDANGNKIELKLTLNQWIKIWLDSGYYHLRGIGPGKYCMSRKNDIGHYENGNVFIQLSVMNLIQGIKLVSKVKAGKKQPNISKALKGHVKKTGPCTVDGITIYSGVMELRKALGQGKNGTRSPGFRFVQET